MVSDKLNHINDVNVYTNELITRMSLNRNFQKLLENDKYLVEKFNFQVDGLDIGAYINGSTYHYGDLVWFRENPTSLEFFLLKCIQDNNTQNPAYALHDERIYGVYNFEKYGWKNQNQKLSLKELGVDKYIIEFVDDKIDNHQNDTNYHFFGKIDTVDKTSQDYIDNKLLKRDVSNVNPNRQQVFFPYQTGHFTTDNIQNGIYRIWDNGLLEMTLCFRLGYSGTINDKKNTQVVNTNDITFMMSPTSNKYSDDYQENEKYFNSTEDMSIFNHIGQGEIKIGNTLQKNRNNYVNVYFATLDFSNVMKFIDTDYMIFSQDTMSQKRSLYDNVNPGTNSMVFCNKKRGEITAIYITTPTKTKEQNNFINQNGLISNTFSCNLIGRYK